MYQNLNGRLIVTFLIDMYRAINCCYGSNIHDDVDHYTFESYLVHLYPISQWLDLYDHNGLWIFSIYL
jgi:hypothetical protein